ncbi:hypothetical protein ABZ820_33820 [Streptomyces diacarni]|uniref:hypothetical protein n=1 Tax=Streptomyces diacarni TaxID=2800381 RepID=UPI0033F8EE47
MTTEIFQNNPGRGFTRYDLVDEATRTYNLEPREAHEAINAFLEDLANDDPTVILDRQPVRPELLTSNPGHVDVDHWLTVSDETADHIRTGLAAVYADSTA